MNTSEKIKKEILDRREKQMQRYHRLKYTKSYIDKRRIKQKNWYYRHPFKRMLKAVKKRGKIEGELKPIDFWKLAKLQKMICPLTGRRLSSENISVDHIVPLSKGGKNLIDNFRLVDKHANLARLNYTDEEFFQLCQDIIQHQNSIK